MSRLEIDYDNCPECESLNVTTRFIAEDKGGAIYEVNCRECGASWDDVGE